MVAGPAAAAWLADYGAEVIKLEPPDGDGGRKLASASASGLDPSPIFGVYNTGKRGSRVDLKSAEGISTVRRLVEDIDVLVESSTPGAMDRLGLGPDELLAINPRLVYASVSGFGWTEVARGRRGVDQIVQAESGMMVLTGYADGPPTKVGFTVVDAACGHALCHGILAQLFQRERTGRGGWVRISLYDVAVNLQAGPIAEYVATGEQPGRLGNSAGHTSPADLFHCSDGDIIVAAYLQAHWLRLVDVLGDPALAMDERFLTPERRVNHRNEVNAALASHFSRDTCASWVDRLNDACILVALAKDYATVLTDATKISPGLVEQRDGRALIHNPVDMVGTPRTLTEAYVEVEVDQLCADRPKIDNHGSS
jgi:crotonobetainyl-CoA:carnitine CoA-transferase CaiB-like acyl-CoA transferase